MKPDRTHPPAAAGLSGHKTLAVWALTAALLFTTACGAQTARADDAVTLGIQSQATYTLGPGDSKPLARRLALFRAKVRAADQAANRFEQQKMIQFVDRDKNELVQLVAEHLKVKRFQDRCTTDGQTTTCLARVQAAVRLSDFIEAQLTSFRIGKEEDEDNYRHEMEPQIPSPFKPGWALAKVYRMIDKQELRMAIIYLNRLAQGYPNWGEIYELKATALRQQHEPVRMRTALRKACQLGRRRACAELK
jgi:hypothetical protein